MWKISLTFTVCIFDSFPLDVVLSLPGIAWRIDVVSEAQSCRQRSPGDVARPGVSGGQSSLHDRDQIDMFAACHRFLRVAGLARSCSTTRQRGSRITSAFNTTRDRPRRPVEHIVSAYYLARARHSSHQPRRDHPRSEVLLVREAYWPVHHSTGNVLRISNFRSLRYGAEAVVQEITVELWGGFYSCCAQAFTG